jgi:hypothetical protein
MPYTLHLTTPLLAQGLFFILLFIFSLYGVFLAYHWYTFGTSNHTSTIALAVYLLGGAVLFLTFAAGIGMLP